MPTPLITIIVPIYNVENFLYRCIKSILAQTYTNLEIILVDDGSLDTSGDICDEFAKVDNRIKVIHKKNGGVSSARNIGLDSASGEYVSFVDSDDYVDLNYIEKLYFAMSNSVDVVVSMYKLIDIDNNLIKNCVYDITPQNLKLNDAFNFISENNFVVWGKLYRKSILINMRFNETIHLCEDALFFAELLLKCKSVKYISDCTYNYIVYENSLCRGKINDSKLTIFIAWQNIIKLFSNYRLLQEKCCIYYLEQWFNYYKSVVEDLGPKNDLALKLKDIINSEESKKIINLSNNSIRIKLKILIIVHNYSFYKILCKIIELLHLT